jgi:WS/DGAT/MGAT family acyltransferase
MSLSVYTRLSAQDASNLALDSAAGSMEMGALLILQGAPLTDPSGRLRLDQLRLRVAQRLGGAPELTRRIRFPGPFAGRPVWIDDAAFAIDRHVLTRALPAPGGDPELLAMASELMGSRLDLAHPPWQMWFLTGLSGGRVGLLVKLHHVLADGRATINLARSLLDLARVPVDRGLPIWKPGPAPGYAELLLDNVAGRSRALLRRLLRFGHPAEVAHSLEREIAGVHAIVEAGRGAPRLSINRSVTGHRHLRTIRLELDAVKAAAHAHGAKVNDVVLDLVAGGLYDLLEWRGEPVAGVCVHASVAVSLRGPDDSARTGNQVGSRLVALPLDTGASDRLDQIARASRQARAEQRATTAARFMVLLAHARLAPAVIRRQHLVNVLVSNMAGPTIPLYLMGAEVLEAIAITPTAGNVGLSFGVLSYAGKLAITVAADSTQAADIDVLLAGMERAWTELAGGLELTLAAR